VGKLTIPIKRNLEKKKKKKKVEGERSSEVANKKLCEFFELFPYKREKLPVYFTRRPKIG
jgi:hypothetical protein